jgi:uncharacterized repeat protein (TIGR03803 family)
MKNTTHQRNWIARMSGAGATAALALAAVLALAVITTQAAQAQTFTTLHSFDGTDGASPYAALVQATNGDFYGTTSYGGANGTECFGIGCGTVFKMTSGGTLTTLYSFCPQSGCTDGAQPYAPLIQAANGNVYGTTAAGGDNNNGTIFEITPGGTLTTVHTFDGTDGAQPYGALIQASNGDFYGTTSGGGFGVGTVYRLTPGGTLTTLYKFCTQSNCTDGEDPHGALIQATNGDLYGTTVSGGANCISDGGCGTIFEITTGGALTTLYSFCPESGCLDGEYPYGALVQAANGDFYGTTAAGGANNTAEYGAIFSITPGGTLRTLYSFCSQSGCTDGYYPHGALIQATNGNFYGTTLNGGTDGNLGTVFELTPNGTLTTLQSFDGTDGYYPYGALMQATSGIFYGPAGQGGAGSDGTVFSLSVGLGPFVETQTTSGKVGAAVKILGTNLTGATSVTFNGTAATFTATRSVITTTVPSGATTGTVEVTVSGHTLKSNTKFRVTP